MSDNLKKSIEKLYLVFALYQGLSKLEGSSLYENIEVWKKQMRSKKLRELTDEDLALFAGKVLLTWGDENDYRYYLPRILELTAELKTPYDIWTLYSRLEDASWKTWEIDEQNAINDFTRELWNSILNDPSEHASWEFKDYFHAITNFYPDFSDILKIWKKNESFASIKHLTNYVLEERHNLFDQNFINCFEKNTKHIEEFKAWLTSENILKKIEKAFYENETSAIAEQISWVEQLLNQEKQSLKTKN